MKKNIILMRNWIELANDAFETSRNLMYEKLTSKQQLNLPAYLLHLSIELYLKAFLMNHGIPFEHNQKGHDLELLFKKCLSIDANLNEICFRSPEVPHNQSHWIKSINDYGKNGGTRYLSSKRDSWQFFVMIHDYLDDLCKHISQNVDLGKDIGTYL